MKLDPGIKSYGYNTELIQLELYFTNTFIINKIFLSYTYLENKILEIPLKKISLSTRKIKDLKSQ